MFQYCLNAGQNLQVYGISTYHQPQNKIRSLLVHPKDKTSDEDKCGIVYEITCDQDNRHKYIGETKRSLGTRLKEHQKLEHPTAIYRGTQYLHWALHLTTKLQDPLSRKGLD